MAELDSQKKRRTQEEIIDLIYEALSEDEDDLMSVKAIAVLSEVDRETCKRNLEVIAHIQSKQGDGWLIVQRVKDENQQVSQTLYRRRKKRRRK